MVKRLLCIIAVLCMSLHLFAYDFFAVNSDGDTIYYKITWNSTVEVTSGGYSGEINIPSSVTYQGTIYSVTNIGYHAFYRQHALTKVTIPNSVVKINTSAFYESGLKTVTISNSVVTIDDYAFGQCSQLTSVFIPSSVTRIGENPFVGNTVLDTVIVASGNTIFDSRDNCNAIIETSTNKLVTGCRNTVIPNTVTTIGTMAFKDLDFTSIIIPSSVTSLASEAFAHCDSLTSITSLATTAPQITSNTFYSVNESIPVYIPCGSASSYNSVWTRFSNFTEIPPYIFSVTSANETMGEVSIVTPATCTNPTATIQAVANPGFQFTSWSDGNTQNPRNITVSSDIILTANFSAENSGIKINNVEITSANAANFTAPNLTGTVTYDGNTNVLTLDNVSASTMIFSGNLTDVNVVFNGNNQFSTVITNTSEHKITFSGQTSTAQLTTTRMSTRYSGSDLELANGIFRINENMSASYGLYGYGDENLTITNAEVFVGGSACAVDGWNSITFNGCEIVEPVGAVVEDGCVKLNGEEISNGVVHIAPIVEAIDIVRTTEFAIVPNPATEVTTLMLEPYTGTATMQIVDANGRVITIVQLPAQQENYRLDVSTLEVGTYFINVTANGTRQTATLVKK